MKLWYNSVALHDLGTLRLLALTTGREPVEAPQRERVTLRVRLDFFEASLQANHDKIALVLAALKTQQATLLWQENDGSTRDQRTVTVTESEAEPGNAERPTFWQAITFSCYYYDYSLTANTLAATLAGQDLGSVEAWDEAVVVERFHALRPLASGVTSRLSARGRWQPSETLKNDLTARRTALDNQRKALQAVFAAAHQTQALTFAGETYAVEVSDFSAAVNQPNWYLEWTFTATYTRYPNRDDYLTCSLEIQRDQRADEGIVHLTLSGKLGAVTQTAAENRLTALRNALAPAASWFQIQDRRQWNRHEITQGAEAITATGYDPDTDAMLELAFTLEFRDLTTQTCTYTPTGVEGAIDLGVVDSFNNRWNADLFSDLRAWRQRTGGVVTLGGRWFAPDSLSVEEKEDWLEKKLAALEGEAGLDSAPDGTLTYGEVFDAKVRLIDFDARINRLKGWLEWSLTANFTRHPDESGYVIADFRTETRESAEGGAKTLVLSGRIGAESAEAAQTALGQIRETAVPDGYVLTDTNQTPTYVNCADTGGPTAASGFLELHFTDTFHWEASGSVLRYTLRITDDDDARSGGLTTTYAGTVTATGDDEGLAWTAAQAKAEALAADKYPFLVRSSLTRSYALRPEDTALPHVVTLDFSYVYQRKGEKVYAEVTVELAEDTFGQASENVSGMIAAPSYAAANAWYEANVRSDYTSRLILNERRPSAATVSLATFAEHLGVYTFTELDSQFTTFAFGLQVFRARSAALALRYDIQTSDNVLNLERRTTVSGTCHAATEVAALDAITTLLDGRGTAVESTRRASHLAQGTVDEITQVEFSDTFVTTLTGVAGILECECSERIRYSGDRYVERPLPYQESLIQGPLGTTMAVRSVTASCTATTETSAVGWIRDMRDALLTGGGSPQPPEITVTYAFLPVTTGVPRGTGANVRVVRASGTFEEWLPVLRF